MLTVLNAAPNPRGGLDEQDPPVFTAGLGERFRLDYPKITASSATDGRRWDCIQVGEILYRPRSVMGTEPGYRGVARLDMLAGRFIDDEDMAEQRHVVVLSAEAARTLFGEPDAP